jgi:general secretion pathway protein G
MKESHKPWDLRRRQGKSMRCTDFLKTLLIRSRPQKNIKAFTLVELLLIIAIMGVLGAIAVPTYNNHMDEARNATAMADIRLMEGKIVSFQAENGRLPDTLAEAGLPNQLDPWGNPYEYLKLQDAAKKDLKGGWRRDRFINPLNTDFDLYSMGKDGKSKPPLTAKDSHDDIVRANNGAFVGLASNY